MIHLVFLAPKFGAQIIQIFLKLLFSRINIFKLLDKELNLVNSEDKDLNLVPTIVSPNAASTCTTQILTQNQATQNSIKNVLSNTANKILSDSEQDQKDLESLQQLIIPFNTTKLVKKSRKIYMPTDKYPTFNFVGRIVGPRGRTIKEIEQKTGVKIVIRGRGSMKDSNLEEYRRSKPGFEHLFDQLHVILTVDAPENICRERLDLAEKEIKLLTDPEGVESTGLRDDIKRKQLSDLAFINRPGNSKAGFNPGRVNLHKKELERIERLERLGMQAAQQNQILTPNQLNATLKDLTTHPNLFANPNSYESVIARSIMQSSASNLNNNHGHLNHHINSSIQNTALNQLILQNHSGPSGNLNHQPQILNIRAPIDGTPIFYPLGSCLFKN